MPQHNQVPEGEANINGRLELIEKGIEKLQKTLDDHCQKEDDNAIAIKALTEEVRENRKHADKQHAEVMQEIRKLGGGK